ncbi:MAG TPA: DMT family transporter [Polyangiaceae bacterium]
MTDSARATLQVVVATVLFSFVGPLAKLLPMNAGAIAFWRSVLGIVALSSFALTNRFRQRSCLARKKNLWHGQNAHRRVSLRHSILLLGTGLFTAGNWYFYVQAAKVSSVAVAVVVLFTYPLFISLMEPLIFRDRFRWINVGSGVFVLAGVMLITDRFSLANTTTLGAMYALVASLSFTASSLTNRRFVRTYSATTVMLHQMLTCSLVFAPAGWVTGWPGWRIFGLLILLGAGLTAISQTLYVASLRQLTSSHASILVSLQPIYTTLIAIPMLHEVPELSTLGGGALILGAVIGSIVTNSQRRRRRGDAAGTESR